MVEELLNDKSKKPKEKTELLSQVLLSNPKILWELIESASSAKDPVKARKVPIYRYVFYARTIMKNMAYYFNLADVGDNTNIGQIELLILNKILRNKKPHTFIAWGFNFIKITKIILLLRNLHQ